ncbi:hypothetical protein HYS03_00990 [Candidatus Woesebacteria bacterium]|nr:hypothetical protein [Candidatus Woesebacteria bacterium]QQG47814.1 MAG: hypothetical protein HY044_01850 [Candidatus Woesebacteria bacterium]
MNSEGKSAQNINFGLLLENKELLQVMAKLNEIKTVTPKAQMKANATSMTDNNGKRIIFMLTKGMF